MKKYIKYIILITALLVLLDQGTKLLVDNLYSFDKDPMQVADCIHLHPVINDSTLEKLMECAEKTSISVGVWLTIEIIGFVLGGAFVCFVFYIIYCYLYDKKVKMSLYFLSTLLCIIIAQVICKVLDDVFRGGTLDWLCISKTTRFGGNYDIFHYVFDLRDIYIFLIWILFFVEFIVLFVRLLKDKEARDELNSDINRKTHSFFHKLLRRK